MKASQCLLLLVLVTVCATLSAASSGGDDCDSVIYTMLPCLSFVENGSKVAKPDADCCSAFSKLVKTHPGCLCEAMNAGSTFGIPINMTKALTLPKACGVKVHHKPHCGAPTPAPAPAPAPASEPPKPPTPSPSPSPSPVAPVTPPSSQPPVPSPTQTTSGAPVAKISSTVALLGLMVSALAYFF